MHREAQVVAGFLQEQCRCGGVGYNFESVEIRLTLTTIEHTSPFIGIVSSVASFDVDRVACIPAESGPRRLSVTHCVS